MGKYIPPTSEELHSLGVGAMDGISHNAVYNRMRTASQLVEDIKAEPHYYRLGYFVTNRAKWVAGVLAAWAAI